MKPIWQARDKPRWLKRVMNRARLLRSHRLGWQCAPGLSRVPMFESTNGCYLRRLPCPTGAGTLAARAYVAFDLFQRTLAGLDGALVRLMLDSYGEPFVHPSIFWQDRPGPAGRGPHPHQQQRVGLSAGWTTMI